MNLRFPLEEYFRYHPPTTPERVALHARVNTMALECCKELFEAIDYNGEPSDLDPKRVESHRKVRRIGLAVSAVTKALIEIEEITQDQTCITWARNALHSAEVYACGQYKEGVLMAVQQCRMFLNQGVTMDSLEGENK